MIQGKRLLLSGAILSLAAFAALAATADPVILRQQMMKDVALATKDASGLARGAIPFDVAKAKATLQVYIDAGTRFPKLFPAASRKTKLKNAAAPKIWTDIAGFKKASAKFAADAQAALTATDTAQFAEAFKIISADCASCHKDYRAKTAP